MTEPFDKSFDDKKYLVTSGNVTPTLDIRNSVIKNDNFNQKPNEQDFGCAKCCILI